MTDEQEHNITPEQEIAELEWKLAEKKKALGVSGNADAVPEKEVFKEVLREHIEGIKSTPPKQVVAVQPPITAKSDDDTQKKKEEEKQKVAEEVRALIEVALTRTIQDAVVMAGEKTPHLLDELHDHLVDDYYEKLIASRKLTQL